MDTRLTNRKLKDRIDAIVGNNIRLEREARRFSRDELAEMMGLTSSSLGLIERGERGATAVNLSKLSVVLDIPVDRLFNSTHDKGGAVNKNDLNPYYGQLKALATCITGDDLEFLVYVAKGIVYKSAKSVNMGMDA